MTDNRTTELLMREFVDVACECEVRDYLISEYANRIEQAVAATLGKKPNESMRVFDSMETALDIVGKEVEIERLERENRELCDENAELTRLRAELESRIAATLSGDRIAELEAEVERLRRAGYEVGYHDAMKALGSGECEFKPFRGPISDMDEIGDRQGVCSECSAYMHEQFNFCPNCGKAVKVVDA